MTRLAIRAAVAAAALLALAGPSLHAAAPRLNAIERFGIGGYIQPVGLHHGFHIERVVPGSAAAEHLFQPHDVIVKVDGEAIRSLDHLRAALAEAYSDDGDVTITYFRGGNPLAHHELKCDVKKASAKAVGSSRKADRDGVTR